MTTTATGTTTTKPNRKPAHEHKPRSGRPPGQRRALVDAARESAVDGVVDVAAVAAKLGLDLRYVHGRLLSYRYCGHFSGDIKIPKLTETCVKCGVVSDDTGKGDAYGHPGRLCRPCYGRCKSVRHREIVERLPVGKEKVVPPSEVEVNRVALLAEIEDRAKESEKEWKEKKCREHRAKAEGVPRIVAAECLVEWRRARRRTTVKAMTMATMTNKGRESA